jgi:hypothetical protein
VNASTFRCEREQPKRGWSWGRRRIYALQIRNYGLIFSTQDWDSPFEEHKAKHMNENLLTMLLKTAIRKGSVFI